MLADADTGYGGGDGTILAAHLDGCVRLRIEGIEMTWTTVVENKDARLDSHV